MFCLLRAKASFSCSILFLFVCLFGWLVGLPIAMINEEFGLTFPAGEKPQIPANEETY